jgi:formylglycine-generating enzyme required for sulfatase activity
MALIFRFNRISTLALGLLLFASTAFAAPLIEMVNVKGGCFQMGDTFDDGSDKEKPVHEVCVANFSIGKYEITQTQWKSVMGNNPSKFTGNNLPVETVSWYNVQTFIGKLNSLTGKQYRLPTEAEWEYAAKSGGKEERWAGVSDPSLLDEYAWNEDNSGKKTHPVGTKKPNKLGIYDMTGNVFEWCQDIFRGDWYEKSEKNNPLGPAKGPERVVKGGCWYSAVGFSRTAYRFGHSPDHRNSNLGFRLVLPMDPANR